MAAETNQLPLTFDSMLAALAASDLVPAEDLSSEAAQARGDVDEFGRRLAARGLLTPFQFAAIREGRGGTLRVGNYDVLDRLGAGGMGTVFKARHRRMKRIVALKVLSANLSQNPVFVKRFQREVETIAALGHPNIVMAYDADEADVGHFLVMEFVNGRDLAACVAREGTFTIHRAVRCVLQSARGLAYAHAQNIIHRDIKPHNLLCDDQGTVKVTDLGLARLNHGADGPAEGLDVTMAGGVIGTADFMPPEQAIDSTTIDHRADIYSLGCTLHYLLTSKPPYTGPTLVAILLKHRDGPVPKLVEARPDCPPALDKIFQRMLAKDPDWRQQSMSEVVTELEQVLAALGPEPAAIAAPSGSAAPSSAVRSASSETRANGSTTAQQYTDATMMFDSTQAPASVLIVEPSRVQAAIIKGFLAEGSMLAVGAVAKGADAIESIRSLRPQAVVATMYLADMNGIELARRIRSEIKDAPGFVLVASEALEEEAAQMSDLNRVHVLYKPFQAAQMIAALQHVMGASAAMSAANVAPAATSGASPAGSSATGKVERKTARVLLVDDSATARAHVRRTLEGLGFAQFVEVPDGAHAIPVAARDHCHLIVTDYNMPLMDGRALVSYLKQDPATQSIPILMVTSETEAAKLDAVRRLGVTALFEKHFPVDQVGPVLDAIFPR